MIFTAAKNYYTRANEYNRIKGMEFTILVEYEVHARNTQAERPGLV